MINLNRIVAVAFGLSLLLASHTVPADDARVVSVEDALTMMDSLPAREIDVNGPPHRWSRQGQANRIAYAISKTAGTTEQAATLVVWDVYESNNLRTAAGDGGKSHGPWQISEDQAKPDLAEDPDRAAALWLALAEKSRRDCAALPDDEQLAELASGNCAAGRTLARRRAALVRRALAALHPTP